jgi:peptide/nickel transport system substrate-binding protein
VFIPGFYYIAQQALVPEHIWKDVRDPVSWANPDPVATGPFTEVTSFETQSYQVARNPHYWQLPDRPRVEAIRFLAFPGNEQAAFALVSGELDWAGSFVPAIDRIFAAEDREHHHYWFPPIDGGVLLYANTTRAPYDDVRVRKALSMAIDRELATRGPPTRPVSPMRTAATRTARSRAATGSVTIRRARPRCSTRRGSRAARTASAACPTARAGK